VIGKRGIIVIDTTLTADGAKATLAEIAKVSSKPVTHVILTHGAADHTGGLGAFPVGVTVIAHEGARRDLEAAAAAGGRGALPRNRLPSRYITGLGESVDIDGVKMSFHHWAPAHTNGDMAFILMRSHTGGPDLRDLAPYPARPPRVVRGLIRASLQGWARRNSCLDTAIRTPAEFKHACRPRR
jgi:hypothetical protein